MCLSNLLKLGVVDLDTSHPHIWVPLLRRLGYDVAAVFDGGVVHKVGYADTFATKHAIPQVWRSVEDMASSDGVEMAIIHTCDWGLHAARAWPFIQLNKPIFIDKPIAGSMGDLAQLASWAAAGSRITGGSALRFCQEVLDEREFGLMHGPILSAMVGCGIDEFNYGIHAYALACGLMGPQLIAVRHLGVRRGRHQIDLRWNDDRYVSLVAAGANWLPFFATVIYQDTVRHFQVNTDALYQTLLTTTMPYLSGRRPDPPIPFAELIVPEKAALAARLSLLRQCAWVEMHELDASDVAFDGTAFARHYKIAAHTKSQS